MPVPDEKRCQGTSRTTGKRCGLKAIPPSKYCQYHGAQGLGNRGGRGVPKGTPKPPGSGMGPGPGNTNAMTHGATTAAMSPAMQTLADSIFIRYTGGAGSISETDMMAFERVAALEAKFRLAVANDETPPLMLDIIHRTLHRELKALKATREMRESNTTGTSPAEVIASIMVKVAERRQQLQEGRQIQAPRVVQHVPAKVTREAVVVAPTGQGDDDGARGDAHAVDEELLAGDELEARFEEWDAEDQTAMTDQERAELEAEDDRDADADQAGDGDEWGWPE